MSYYHNLEKKNHLVSFHSRKFCLIEINYDIHDKELLAIMNTFEEWCHLFGVQNEIIMYFDCKKL
jgi:hypothetical protein